MANYKTIDSGIEDDKFGLEAKRVGTKMNLRGQDSVESPVAICTWSKLDHMVGKTNL